ncbi:MarR family winged helix-turn-helix transcriptional regulator [Helcococcus kunzii]|uniref:MarR family winged helix-turn-helix transcriptional regulator n=2 Tax=Helcococcus kunzii TaxID=40091 RepID=UPI001BB06EE6|nr:MarR family transcriptional regulator [Helcococcus kunzii]MCT1797004.1 MarR family transcriptional regulator [Helcococcus kunzii]MCT1988439.1 MarR family transcriptional regulator [Helcococcus kunzii]QUY65706.1 MarR family transcriptional regulator [Helcococcus kunzii]QZO76423.1 MarR family transcriptional regulator [Helcococcus kunzii]
MFDLDYCVSFVTNLASKKLSESLNSKLIKHNVTKSQWIALYYINREKSISQKNLATLMGAKESTVTGILNRVEKEDLIMRTEDKKDKRKNLLSLTEKGQELTEKLTDIAQEFRDACLDGVSLEEQEIFLKVLDKMVSSAQNWQEEM